MAVPGRDPSEKKHGRTPLTTEWRDVVNVPYEGPKISLPSKLLGDRPHAEVKAWWKVVSSMPHCVLWEPSDWLYALDTAILKQHFYSGAAPVSMMTEIRQREDVMGLTVEARRKLRIRYVDAPVEESEEGEKPPACVSSLAERRERLTNAS